MCQLSEQRNYNTATRISRKTSLTPSAFVIRSSVTDRVELFREHYVSVRFKSKFCGFSEIIRFFELWSVDALVRRVLAETSSILMPHKILTQQETNGGSMSTETKNISRVFLFSGRNIWDRKRWISNTISAHWTAGTGCLCDRGSRTITLLGRRQTELAGDCVRGCRLRTSLEYRLLISNCVERNLLFMTDDRQRWISEHRCIHGVVTLMRLETGARICVCVRAFVFVHMFVCVSVSVQSPECVSTRAPRVDNSPAKVAARVPLSISTPTTASIPAVCAVRTLVFSCDETEAAEAAAAAATTCSFLFWPSFVAAR